MPSAASTSTSTTLSASPRACVEGPSRPVRIRIAGLGIDAAVEVLKASGGSIGDPDDRRNLGWSPLGATPCAGKGTVLIDGHTYHDDSAVFKESFARTDKVGMVIEATLADGSLRYYRVVFQTVVPNADWERYVNDNDLYDQRKVKPERMVVMTCQDWNGRQHTTEGLLIAVPISAP